jgi:hypothetical protein
MISKMPERSADQLPDSSPVYHTAPAKTTDLWNINITQLKISQEMVNGRCPIGKVRIWLGILR